MTPQTAMMLDDRPLKEAMALTAGMIAFIDDAVGDILGALEANGQMDNTVICYNADHGDYLGDFNMLLKGALPFRSISRVPFIWSDPDDCEAAATDALCSTVDLAASILDRAGLERVADGLQAMKDKRHETNDLGQKHGLCGHRRNTYFDK